MPIAIVTAALVRDGRILLAHRHPARQAYPDCWDLVGGHVEDGESPLQAVIRECAEELGVQIIDPRSFRFTTTNDSITMHAFAVTRWEGEPANMAPDEHDQIAWFDDAELRHLKLAHPAGLPDILAAIGH